MNDILELKKYMLRRQALEAIGETEQYVGAYRRLGYTPESDAAYIVAAQTTLNAGSGAQANRRLAERRLTFAGRE